MRYELSDYEWTAIKPMLPDKPRGGLPVHLALTPGEAHDNRLCSVLLSALLLIRLRHSAENTAGLAGSA